MTIQFPTDLESNFNELMNLIYQSGYDPSIVDFYYKLIETVSALDPEKVELRDQAIALTTVASFLLHTCNPDPEEATLTNLSVIREVGEHFLRKKKIINMFNTGTVQ